MTEIELLSELGWMGFYIYLFLRYVLPRISPTWLRIVGNRENIYISIIKDSNKSTADLAVALSKLSSSIDQLNHRVEKVEDTLKSKSPP